MTETLQNISHPQTTTRATTLILYISVNFNQLHTFGKAYRWPRPQRCPRCRGSRLWGHGYVGRYFDTVPTQVPMKRWRCPDCGAVHTMRPHTHWRGFWASKSVILASIERKESMGKWLPEIGREHQQYWWQGYRIQRQFAGRMKPLSDLIAGRIIAATHSFTHREITVWKHPPHRIFAFTAPVRGP